MSKYLFMLLHRSSRSLSLLLASLLPSSSSFLLLLNLRVINFKKRVSDNLEQASCFPFLTSKILLPFTVINDLLNVFIARLPFYIEECSPVNTDLQLNSISKQVEKKHDNSSILNTILPVRTNDIKLKQRQRRSLQQNSSNNSTMISKKNVIQKKNKVPSYQKQLLMPSIVTSACICLISAFSSLSNINAKAQLCISCSKQGFEEFKQIRQEQILTDLLKKLELTAKPNITVDYDNLPPIGRNNPRIRALIEQSLRENHRRVRKNKRSILSMIPEKNENGLVPQYYNNVKEYFPSLYETDANILPETSYIVSQLPPNWFKQNGHVSFFKFPRKLNRKFINKATLTLYVKKPQNKRFLQLPIRIDVFERFRNGSLGDKIATKHEQLNTLKGLQTQVHIHLDEMDVQQWLSDNNNFSLIDDNEGGWSYVGLYVQAIYNNENIVLYSLKSLSGGLSNGMFMELEVFDNRRSLGRLRRTTQPMVCRPGSNETKCCLYDLMIDFEKVGWDFVIAPKRYNSYICNGECTYSQISQTPRGTIAQRAYLDYWQCCHPKEYSSITIAYITEANEIWIKEVPEMVARRCGCA